MILTQNQKTKIINFLNTCIFDVVMTSGGGLYTVSNEIEPPIRKFTSFNEYNQFALGKCEKFAKKNAKIITYTYFDEFYNDGDNCLHNEVYDLFLDLLPMYRSEKDDGGIVLDFSSEFEKIFLDIDIDDENYSKFINDDTEQQKEKKGKTKRKIGKQKNK